jgi:hypothetical protein
MNFPEVPSRPNGEDMQFYRTNAATLLRAAIFSAIREQDSMEMDVYAHAAAAVGEYAIARARWLKHQGAAL